jgi:phage terminase large subunit-like protein
MRSAFFSFLRHSKGEWAGSTIRLEPWQEWYLGVLFGWLRSDGTRRFRTSYLEVARKNGKSTILAGVGLYLLVADGEPGAEVYTAATKMAQAQIIFLESQRMVSQSPDLKRLVGSFKNNLHVASTFSKYEPVGRDSDTLDGLNVHGGLVDELHAHPTGDMWDVLETGTGSRRQPLMAAVTTAGSNRQGVCYQFHDYTEKLLSGVVDDDAWHGVIYTLDRDPDTGEIEDWRNERTWIKANPNLGVSKKADDLRDKARKAGQMPSRLNAFLTKELNVWTQAASRWISPERWQACNLGPVDEAALAGRPCWGGLDLSSTLDVTALAWVFPAPDGRPADVLMRMWIPEENWERRVREERAPYDVWIARGLLTLTPGNVVDYDFILHQVEQDVTIFQVQELAFDPWNATSVTNKIGLAPEKLVEFRQGYVSMNPAMKALEVAIQRRAINHGGHAGLAWMADNLTASYDPASNAKPDKSKSTERIDGMVALIMAYYRSSLASGPGESVYERRGLRVL